MPHSAFSDITPTQYTAAYLWLQNSGLLSATFAANECTRAVFEAALREAIWFADSDVLVLEPNSLPEDGICAADALHIPPGEAFALLRHCWGKVDAAERSRVGAAGERALLALLETVKDLRVRYVAAESDGYGYDISVETPCDVIHIEVKSTTRCGRLCIYMSRNEFETMKRDEHWVLVAVRLDDNLEAAATATLSSAWLGTVAPNDRPGGRWESVKIDVPPSALDGGIRKLTEQGYGLEIPVLRGSPRWPGH